MTVRRGEQTREALDVREQTIRAFLPPIHNDIPHTWRNNELRAAHDALDSLLAAVAAAEQERAEIVSYWQERHQVRTDQLHAAVARADALETALNQIASDIHPARPLDEERPRWLHENSVWWHHYSPQEIARAALASSLPDRDETE